MNTPNKLTIFRIILSPVFLFFLLADYIPHSYLIADLIFIIASITDMLDGSIARKNNLITDFGKFLDPLADKMLVNAALIGFLAKGLCGKHGAWLVFIVLTREFLVTSLRLVAASGGKVIAAGNLGKAKTISQMAAIIAVMTFMEAIQFLPSSFDMPLRVAGVGLLWISTILAVISGAEYLYANRNFVDHKK